MKQLTINIPDYYYKTFMEFFKRIPEASLLNESDYVMDEKTLSILDARKKTPLEKYLTREESNKKLKGI